MELQQHGSQITGIASPGVSGHYVLVAFRWMLTTSWFLFLLAAILASISLLASFYTDAWHWFQRSGALMVSIGAILSTRHPLGLILDSMISDSAPRIHNQSDESAFLNNMGELRTCICGFIFVAMGTLTWAYGDLLGCLVHWDSSCLV
ncbi:MAG: hypothetical protein ACERLB_13430 [Gammaproteobacteria bacterium]